MFTAGEHADILQIYRGKERAVENRPLRFIGNSPDKSAPAAAYSVLVCRFCACFCVWGSFCFSCTGKTLIPTASPDGKHALYTTESKELYLTDSELHFCNDGSSVLFIEAHEKELDWAKLWLWESTSHSATLIDEKVRRYCMDSDVEGYDHKGLYYYKFAFTSEKRSYGDLYYYDGKVRSC